MKTKYLAIALAVPVFFTACENPADKTDAAAVKDKVENAATVSEGGTKYEFTPASTVNFTASKVTGSHNGGFKNVKGHFTVKDGALAGNDHKVIIDVGSVFTDAEKLTGHLKSADFFDVEKYPEATFEATSLKKLTDNSYEVSGNFTLHGVTKNITFKAITEKAGDLVKINSVFNINRQDFKIVYPGKAEDLIRDEVVIDLKLEVKAGA